MFATYGDSLWTAVCTARCLGQTQVRLLEVADPGVQPPGSVAPSLVLIALKPRFWPT